MKIVYYILIGIVFAACNSTPQKEEKMAAMPMMMQSFETISIKKSNPLVPLKLAGELISDRETSIYAKVNSYVKKMSVDIGSTVTAGQVIMVLEAPEIQAQLAAAKSKWKAQEAIYIATKSNYDRMFKANETKGAIAKDALDQITARKLSDQAQLEAAKSAYQEIQVMNDYLIIRAPFNGIVAERNVDLGSYVGPMGKGSDKPLLVIQDNKKLRISLSIPEANTPYLKLGDSIHFKINSIPNKKYMAKISRKSGVLDFKLRSEKIEADIMQAHKELKPLMVAEAMLPLQANEPTFFVPKTALVESNTGVYVIRIENSLTKNIPVTKGRALADQVEVFGELNEEDKILMKATEEILEGTNIKKQKMKRVNKYLIIGAIALVIASCQKQEKKQETIAQKSIEQPVKETFAAPKGIHVTNEEVCMVNNIHMGKKQMEVPFEGKMYYGCCNMCVERISNEESVRTAVDPHTGKKVDKASAYIISLNEEGNVAYFESEENYLNFIKAGS